MSAYEPKYNKPYPDGWKNLPEKDTPITAEILNNVDETFENIEKHLEDNSPDDKMDKNNPTGTGAFTMNNRIANSEVGEYSTSLGNFNAVPGSGSLASGHSNYVECQAGAALGLGNKVGKTGGGMSALGQGNTVDNNGHAIGNGLSSTHGQVSVGESNEDNENTMFEVGIGNKTNGFEVLRDGTVKAKKDFVLKDGTSVLDLLARIVVLETAITELRGESNV